MNIKKQLIYAKFALARSNSYLSLLNAGMILFLFLSSLKQYNYISIDLGQYMIPLYFIGLLCLLFLGYLEIFMLKGMQLEQQMGYMLNPEWIEIKEKIDYIYKKI